jgi:hypothetical protein
LKDYAISGLDAAKDAVQEALQKEAAQSGVATSLTGQLDETSAYYVNFQLVAPALAAVAKQLERLNAQPPHDSAENLRVLGEVVDAYAAQRVQLLSPVLGAWLDAVSQTSDIVNVLRATCTQLLKVCGAEFRLFLKLFGHDPSDELFEFSGGALALGEDDQEDESENAFEYVAHGRCLGVARSLTISPWLSVQAAHLPAERAALQHRAAPTPRSKGLGSALRGHPGAAERGDRGGHRPARCAGGLCRAGDAPDDSRRAGAPDPVHAEVHSRRDRGFRAFPGRSRLPGQAGGGGAGGGVAVCHVVPVARAHAPVSVQGLPLRQGT